MGLIFQTRKSIFGFMPAPTFPFRASAGTVCTAWQSPGMALPSVRRLRYIVFSVRHKKWGFLTVFSGRMAAVSGGVV